LSKNEFKKSRRISKGAIYKLSFVCFFDPKNEKRKAVNEMDVLNWRERGFVLQSPKNTQSSDLRKKALTAFSFMIVFTVCPLN